MERTIGTILIILVIFLLLREVNCWYWKINKIVSLLEENSRLLRTLNPQNHSYTTNETEKVLTNTSNLNEKAVTVSEQEATSITVRHKVNKKIQTVSMEFWEKMKQLYGEESYEIIKYNK